MNDKLIKFKKEIVSKKVAVIGIGVSNTPLIRYLCNLGVDVTAFDRADASRIEPYLKEIEGLDVKLHLGPNYLDKLKGFDIIFKTPVIRYDIPELERARQEGAVVTSEMEVFMELCPAEIFAVTGSDGKTTTTTLIYKMLKKHGYNCWLGGNIGIPLLSNIDEIDENDKVVLELSSFQLHTMKTSADVAVITNISPNHLDVHKSMEEYIEAKKNICRYQNPSQKVVLNYDNLLTRGIGGEFKGKRVFFSRVNKLEEGVVIETQGEGETSGSNRMIVYKKDGISTPVVKTSEIFLKGEHNIENYLAAAAAVIEYVDPEDIAAIAREFTGVEHRNEFVRRVNGVSFYNDSIGSSPTRTIATISAFDQKVILIAGGYDKNLPYDEMGEVLAERVKCLVLTGATAPKIKDALLRYTKETGKGADIPIIMCATFEEAVNKAYDNASEGDIVLLSPASASFDMFRNFEERGNRFKEIVNSL